MDSNSRALPLCDHQASLSVLCHAVRQSVWHTIRATAYCMPNIWVLVAVGEVQRPYDVWRDTSPSAVSSFNGVRITVTTKIANGQSEHFYGTC